MKTSLLKYFVLKKTKNIDCNRLGPVSCRQKYGCGAYLDFVLDRIQSLYYWTVSY